MANFFRKFPKTLYNNNKGGLSNYQSIVNITFRVGFIRDVVSNIGSYYYYTIKDGDTPEILAEKIYGDPEAHWVLLYANDIYDPQYDWPLPDKAFAKYLADKYRTKAAYYLNLDANNVTDQQVIAFTQDLTSANSVHHYEKQIIRTNTTDNVTLTINLEVDKTNLTATLNSTMAIANTLPSGPRHAWEYYTGVSEDARALEYTGAFQVFDNVAGKTVTQETKGVAITYYDYELDLNEKKRQIKIIKPEFYTQISKEFTKLTGSEQTFIRKLV